MSSVSDPPDSCRQENRDMNEKTVQNGQGPPSPSAGGKDVVVMQSGSDTCGLTPFTPSLRNQKKNPCCFPLFQPADSGVAAYLLQCRGSKKTSEQPHDDSGAKDARNDDDKVNKREGMYEDRSPPAAAAKPRRAQSRSMTPSPSRQRSPSAASQSPIRSVSRSRSRSPAARGGLSRSVSPSPRKRRGSYTPSRSRTPDKRRTRSFSRSRSRTPERRRRGASPVRARRGVSPARRRRRSPTRSVSRDRDYRRQERSGERGRVDRGSRAARPEVSQYRKPEKWLLNLFEDALKETLETTRLPCNVSKINDCMRRLDPTYRLEETDFPTFSVMCHWFDDIGELLEVSKRRDSVMLLGSRLEADVVKRLRTPPRGGARPRPKRRGRRPRSPPPRSRRRVSRSPDRSRAAGRGGRRGGDSRSPERGSGRSKRRDEDDRWEME